MEHPCGCVDGQRRCSEADRLWSAANAIYYSQGYDAWMRALVPYNAHNHRNDLLALGAKELEAQIAEDLENYR